MIIEKINIGLYSLPLIKPFKTALRSVYIMESIVIKITTKNGLIGYGETSPTEAITGDTKASIISSLKTVAKTLTGQSVEDGINILVEINDSITGSFNPKSAVEIAIYDILSQNKNKPLYQYLGGKISELKTGTTISLNPVVQMVSDAKEAVDLGFESLKIKFGSSPKEDIERINAIRQAIDTSISIKLDANQGWSPDETVRFLDQITSLDIDIELLEQPVPKNDLTGLKYIKDRTPIPILADESVFSPEDAREILEMDAVDMINIKLDKCGGITKALEVAEISAEYDTKCMIGCMLEGAISVGAAAHVASARSDTIIMYDLDAPILCASSPVKGGVKFVASDVLLSDALGLGITSIPDIEWLN